MKRILCLTVVLMLLGMPVMADDVSEYITDDMEENLPDGIVGDEGISYKVIIDTVTKALKNVLPRVLGGMSALLAVIVLSALFSVLAGSVQSKGIQRGLGYLSTACIAVTVYNNLLNVWEAMAELMSRINGFMVTLTPVTTLLYATGGNLTTAAVNNTAMGIILTVFETICFHCIKPILQICFGFSIINALCEVVDLRRLGNFLRRTYTTVLLFVISSMIAILSLQNMLSASKDSLGMRTVKFAAANSIPIVGGALGEAAATVGVSMSAIRSSFGALAILALIMMIFPTVMSMWLNKISFSLMSAVCSVFGLTKEEGIVSGGAELMNFALAITVSSAVMFIISIYLFASAQAVVGG